MDKFLFVHGGLYDPATSATDKQGLSVPPNRQELYRGFEETEYLKSPEDFMCTVE